MKCVWLYSIFFQSNNAYGPLISHSEEEIRQENLLCNPWCVTADELILLEIIKKGVTFVKLVFISTSVHKIPDKQFEDTWCGVEQFEHIMFKLLHPTPCIFILQHRPQVSTSDALFALKITKPCLCHAQSGKILLN